jgi:shikimate kinase
MHGGLGSEFDTAEVRRVLLTGMSGVGKSSVIAELRARGFKAVDTDDGWCEPVPDGRQRWRETAIRRLLSADDAEVLFVGGCEENQTVFYKHFDVIVLLSAPLPVMLDRLARRTSNPYGKAPGDVRRVLADVEVVEPLLRRSADCEIVTDVPLDVVAGQGRWTAVPPVGFEPTLGPF